MDINGSVNAGELEFTVELDTDEVWREIEDTVNEAAYEVARETAREEMQNADFVDYGEGARELLDSYSPGAGCSLARLFEDAVQSAVQTGDFLKDVVLEQIGEHAAGNASEVSASPGDVDDIGRIRAIVREEIRLAVTAVASQMTSVV